ncbi:ABC-2 transporter permease [Actinocrispum sp. NPDC049592]|uniref:ABC transporter permease n=1 Tax=Actinocrispum sp. NPDC049592 TaxID=3154835 RepID=UPI0034177A70
MTAFVRFEVVRTLRNIRYLAFLVVMPVVFYLLWGRTGGPAAMVAMSVYAACGGALLGSGNTIAEDRFTGWIRQLRVTPLSDRAWLTGKIVQGVLTVIPGVLIVSVVAVFTGHVELAATKWLGLAALFLLGSLPFALIGVFFGMLFRGKTATVALMLVFFALMFIGGVIAGNTTIPGGSVTPTYNLLAAGIQISQGQPIGGGYLLNLGGWTALAGVAVLLRWRRA